MADSARATLDLRHTATVVPYLARAVRLADSARAAATPCLHPSVDAWVVSARLAGCQSSALDLEAAIDLARRRAVEALLLAAGVSVDATADRELIASGDNVPITITVFNRGVASITLSDVSVSEVASGPMQSIVIPAGAASVEYRTLTGLPESHPWWIGTRALNLCPRVASAADGRARTVLSPNLIRFGVSIPEQIRRTSDVSVTLIIAGATVTTNMGPITFRAADPRFGVQNRAVAGVPPVTLAFERGLEWVRARRPMNRPIRLTIESFSDQRQTFALEPFLPDGIRLDSFPPSITLAPRDKRDLLLQLRGSLRAQRYVFGMKGQSPSGTEFSSGFRPIQYAHIPPIRISRTSALYLQGIDVEIPSRLLVAHVRGVGDDIGASLTQIGIATTTFDPARLLMVDLSFFGALVIGPRAYEAHPELAYQNARLLDYARKGGTLVVLQQTAMPSHLLPYPIGFTGPIPEHVTEPDAPVTVLDPKARILNWPNTMTAKDWDGWVRERAIFVPSNADAHCATPIELHDEGERENRNSLLVAPVGKGTYIYSTLTLSHQLAGGVPGALRLLVNLVSAGVSRGANP